MVYPFDEEPAPAADPGVCPATSGAHEQCPTPQSAGWHCGWCGALLSQGRWYPPERPGSGMFAGSGGYLDLGVVAERAALLQCRHCGVRIIHAPGHSGRYSYTDNSSGTDIFGSGSECPKNERGHEPRHSDGPRCPECNGERVVRNEWTGEADRCPSCTHSDDGGAS